MDYTHHLHEETGQSCAMKMSLNWDITGICVIFEWWKIDDALFLFFSMMILFILSAAYEKLREWTREYDRRLIKQRSDDSSTRFSNGQQLQRAVLYGLQITFAFFLMLVFMTYNAFLMFSVIAGAMFGFYLFNKEANIERTMSCH